MLPVPPPPEPSEPPGKAAGHRQRSHSDPSPQKRPTRRPISDSFPKAWITYLTSNVFHYRGLSKAERKRLRNETQEFVAKKNWEGCNGLSVTDEIKVTIAAQACLMLLGREHDRFSRVGTILVYPSAFQVVDEKTQDEGWLPMDATGQAVHRGPVILAWDTVLAEGRDPSAGNNVVIHEFAHQLDFIDAYADGTLDLPGDDAERWQRVLTAEFNRLRRELRQGHETILGQYAATSKTEFFATASERFFTQPTKLRHFHESLYEMLLVIYAIDPERWFSRVWNTNPR